MLKLSIIHVFLAKMLTNKLKVVLRLVMVRSSTCLQRVAVLTGTDKMLLGRDAK